MALHGIYGADTSVRSGIPLADEQVFSGLVARLRRGGVDEEEI